jgi:cell division protein FtsB
MNTRLTIIVSMGIVLLFAMLLFIVFSDNGLADLYLLKNERDRLIAENRRLTAENLHLYRSIERLKSDPAYIESIARKELGMIRKEEIIIKPRNQDKKGSN